MSGFQKIEDIQWRMRMPRSKSLNATGKLSEHRNVKLREDGLVDVSDTPAHLLQVYVTCSCLAWLLEVLMPAGLAAMPSNRRFCDYLPRSVITFLSTRPPGIAFTSSQTNDGVIVKVHVLIINTIRHAFAGMSPFLYPGSAVKSTQKLRYWGECKP